VTSYAARRIPYPAAHDYGSREGWPTLAVTWHMAEGRDVDQYLAGDPLRGVSVHYTIEQETARWQDGQVVRCLPEDRISGSIDPRTIRRGDDPGGYYGASHAKAAIGRYWPYTSPNLLVRPKGDQGPKGDPGASGSSNWGDIANKPAGLADGVDDVGSVGYTTGIAWTDTVAGGSTDYQYYWTWPKQVPVIWTVVPTGTDTCPYLSISWDSWPADASGTNTAYEVMIRNDAGATCVAPYKVRYLAFNSGIATAQLKKQLAGAHKTTSSRPHRMNQK
jgi:hypothetical protein